MDFSPLYISLKTAGLATVITFILGIYAARFICKLKNIHTPVVVWHGIERGKYSILCDQYAQCPLVICTHDK